MEEELDEIARGEREWVPLLREFYEPLKERVAEKRRELRRSDFTTEASDEVCSEGHPMVIRLGRNGRFLACSLFPEHRETRPLPGEEEPELPGSGETCPQCGEGTLQSKRGKFGPFVGCSRYPDCNYIRKEGPPQPDQLPFEVICPKNGDGHLVARRARRTGNVFWGCSAYPKCDFTTNHEPTGALHDADEGPVARKGESGMCLKCGATVELPAVDDAATLIGRRLPGGPPDPAALAGPARSGRRGGARGGASTSSGTGARRRTTTRSGGSRSDAKRARPAGTTPDA
jgi:DNA topoisomerase-1